MSGYSCLPFADIGQEIVARARAEGRETLISRGFCVSIVLTFLFSPLGSDPKRQPTDAGEGDAGEGSTQFLTCGWGRGCPRLAAGYAVVSCLFWGRSTPCGESRLAAERTLAPRALRVRLLGEGALATGRTRPLPEKWCLSEALVPVSLVT